MSQVIVRANYVHFQGKGEREQLNYRWGKDEISKSVEI